MKCSVKHIRGKEKVSQQNSLSITTQKLHRKLSLFLDIMFFHSIFWSTGDFLEHTKCVSHYTLFPCSFSEILEFSEWSDGWLRDGCFMNSKWVVENTVDTELPSKFTCKSGIYCSIHFLQSACSGSLYSLIGMRYLVLQG